MSPTMTRRRGAPWLTLSLAGATVAALVAVAVPASAEDAQRDVRTTAAHAVSVASGTSAAMAGPAVAITTAAAATPAVVPARASDFAAAPCATVYWGSLAKSAPGSSDRLITDVRTGQHRCFDRLVLDLAGPGSGRLGYEVRYGTVRQQGSGAVVALRGGADIQIVVRAAAYDPDTGAATLFPAGRADLADVAGYSALRQVSFAGSFEGQTTIGLGVRARLPMRVFVLPGPGDGQRLVVDVYHRW